MIITGDKVIFETTGREIKADQGVIGLTQHLDVCTGEYKGFVLWLNNKECVEIADFMIARWQEFRKRAKAEVQLT